MNTIIFSHGKKGVPNGAKIIALSKIAEANNLQWHSIDYTKCANVNERVAKLRNFIKEHKITNPILVGSSMGAYISAVISNDMEVNGLFLMAPAFYLPNYDVQSFNPKTKSIEIIHGWNDTTVPYQNSIRFGDKHKATLHMVDDDHRLSNSIPFLESVFLRKITFLTEN